MIDLYEWISSQISTPIDQIKAVLGIYRSIIAPNSAIYISTPITSGPIYNEWYLSDGKYLQGDDYTLSLYENVIKPNVEETSNLTKVLILFNLETLYINPSEFFMPTWTNEDYLTFWYLVIKEFVFEINMRNGWEYSRGCVFEFLTALQNNISVKDTIKFECITKDRGIELISKAIENMDELGVYTEFHKTILEWIKNV